MLSYIETSLYKRRVLRPKITRKFNVKEFLLCNFKNLLKFSKITTLLKLTLLHGCFSRFLNCTNGTKSRNAPQMWNDKRKESVKTKSDFIKNQYHDVDMVSFFKLWTSHFQQNSELITFNGLIQLIPSFHLLLIFDCYIFINHKF